jgi:hypothetical protein
LAHQTVRAKQYQILHQDVRILPGQKKIKNIIKNFGNIKNSIIFDVSFKTKDMFKIGDKVILKRNPLDEQLGEFIPLGLKVIVDVKDVSNITGTSGQWVKIAEHNDWIDSSYFSSI